MEDTSLKDFLELFNLTFSPIKNEEESARILWTVQQGNRSVANFAIDFRILAEKSDWNDAALRGAFYHALNDKFKDDLASREEPETFDKLIAVAIRLDKHLRERSRAKPMLQISTEVKAERRASAGRSF